MIFALFIATITLLNGEGWTCDGVPVSIPHTWNADDYDRGFWPDVGPSNPLRQVDAGNSVRCPASLMKAAAYRRALPDPRPDRRYFVRFDGVCEKAVVSVNGQEVGRHVGAFTPFCFEVTKALKAHGNQLEVAVDNRYDADIPPASADFTMCGGIYRKVEYIEKEAKGIDPTRPTKLFPDPRTGKVSVEVPVLDGGYEKQVYEFGDVSLWSPENPKLYDVNVVVGEDHETRRVGFRKVEFKADGFYLNGVKRRVRGINRHQDVKGKGWAVSPEDDLRDLKMIKEMGCDAVRLCHYPQNEDVYRICDELGLLVWSEVPNVDYLTQNLDYFRNAKNQAKEMIEWRGGHPCVAWWSCYNELYSSGDFKGVSPFKSCGTPAYDGFIRRLCQYMKSLDPTRPVVAAGCCRTSTEIMSIPDQIGFNVYPRWYGSETMGEWIDLFLKCNPTYQSFALSEFGAGASPNQHENPLVRPAVPESMWHPEEYQTKVHVDAWRALSRDSRIWGDFIWCFADFGANWRYEGERPGVNDKGLVSADRRIKKDAYYFYRANWSRGPVLHLCSKRLGETTNAVFEVLAFCNAGQSVSLTVNGRRIAERLPDEVCVVSFGAVPLCGGTNVIRLACGALVDETVVVRRASVRTAAAPLIDFRELGAACRLMGGTFSDPMSEPQQIDVSEKGVSFRFDSTREARAGNMWATVALPKDVHTLDDWFGNVYELELSGLPSGRVQRNVALDFADDQGEVFQFRPSEAKVDSDGNLHLSYYPSAARLPKRTWGTKQKNGKVDGRLRLPAMSFYFSSAEGTGEITLRRLVKVARTNKARDVVSIENISTDTTYPGGRPFPGAEELRFKYLPAVTGNLKLVLSTESQGTAAEGRMLTFSAVGTNGVVRFPLGHAFENSYQFMSLEISEDGKKCRPVSAVTEAVGLFRQTESEALRLDVETGNFLHLVRGDDERPFLRIKNPADRPIEWKIRFSLKDYYGRVVEIPFDGSVEAGGSRKVALPWPMPAKGFWRVWAHVSAGDGSESSLVRSFAVIERHDRTPPMADGKFRVGVHYHGTHYLPNELDRSIEALVACGAKFVRTDYSFMFSNVERREGVFDWSKGDDLLHKLRQAGFSLDIIVGGTPGWAWDQTASWAKSTPTPMRRMGVRPARPGLFKGFCKAIAARYGNEIEYYEAGNEWDLSPQSVLTPEEAVRMQRECYEGVKAGCPTAKVATCGWARPASSDLQGDSDLVNKGLVEAMAQHPEYYDVWMLHGHGGPASYYHQIDDILLPLREATPLKARPWMSNESSQTGAFGDDIAVTRTVWQKILFAWSRGSRDYIWYNLRATGWHDGAEPGFGMVSPDYYPRPSYAAFSALTALFHGLDFAGKVYSRKCRHLLLYRGRSRKVDGMVLATWDENATSNAIRSVRIRTDAKNVRVSDMMGNESPVPVQNGVFLARPLPDPVAYILEGATKAEAVDPNELLSALRPDKVIECRDAGRPADFTLAASDYVKDYYAANPLTTERVWKGPTDHSARIWLDRVSADSVRIRAIVVDDVRTPGDRFEALFWGNDGRMRSVVLKPVLVAGAEARYDEVVQVPAEAFGFDVRIREDDGDGEDGYLRIVNDSEDPVRVRFK